MAFSKCPKCDNAYFELVENTPSKSNYKLLFVQCGKCGCVVGTMDYYNIGTKISELEKKIDSLSSGSYNLSSVNNNLSVINQNLGNLFNFVTAGFKRIEENRAKNTDV